MVSTTGEAPVTVTDSETLLNCSVTFSSMVMPRDTTSPFRLKSANPARVNARL
jgi:hypothetical protein